MNADAQLIDRLMEMYVEWREECAGLWAAYERWSKGTVANRALAHAAYTAALDREEWACRVYADLTVRVASRTAARSPGSESLLPPRAQAGMAAALST